MNRFYRLIWSAARSCWVAVSELARARGKRTQRSALLLAPLLSPLLLSPAGALANPGGGKVVAGQAAIHNAPGQVTVRQSSDKAIIDWRGFSIGRRESTRFVQPSSASVTLNRVTGEAVSNIRGRLSANGKLFLVNPNGVVFGRDARIDVNGLVVSTHDIRNDDFLAGRYAFTRPGKPDAQILNRGTITVAEAGIAAFVAPSVRNDGLIQARLGSVTLAGAEGFSLDLYGDQLVEIAVDPAQLEAYTADGAPLAARVENTGSIEAQTVVMTARGARKAVDGIINSDGIVRATSASLQGGRIVLGGGSETITVAGQLDASAVEQGGPASGGEVLVRGESVSVESTAELKADAATAGGDGGFIDTSGQQIAIAEGVKASARAPSGSGGTWLIDPTDMSVEATTCSGTNCASAQAITASLDSGTSVTLSTDAGGTGDGNVEINADINKTAGGDAKFTVNAHNDIELNADLTSSSGKLDMEFNADLDNAGGGTLRFGNTTLDPNGGQLTVTKGKAEKSTGTSVIHADLALSDFSWTGGTLAGPGALNTTGTTTLSGTHYGTLQDKVWNNTGTINFTDSVWLYLRNTTPSSGPDTLPTLNNLAGAVINMNSTAARPFDGSSYSSDVHAINNAGTLNWNNVYGPWNYGRIDRIDFTNSGTVNINAGGNLQLANSNGSDTGTYNIAAGQFLETSGTRTLENGASIQGSGVFRFTGGDFMAMAGSSMAPSLGLAISGGTLSSEIDLAPSSLAVSGGTLVANGDITTANLAWTYGVITGDGTLNTTGTATLSGNAYGTLRDKVWNNSGTLGITDSAYLYLRNTTPNDSSPDILPTFNNLAGGVVNMDSNDPHPIYGSDYSANVELFNNAGTLNWNTQYGPWGYSRIDRVDFNNSGTLNIGSGANLEFHYSAGNDTGTYNVAAGQFLRQNQGDRVLANGASIQGSGTLRVAGGSLTAQTGSTIPSSFDLLVTGGTLASEIDLAPTSLTVSGGALATSGSLNISTLTLSGGTLSTEGNLNVGSLDLTRGVLSGGGALTTTGTTTLSGNSFVNLRDKVWNNAGTLNITDSAYLYLQNTTPSDSSPDILPTFNNMAGGTVNMNSTATRPIDAHYYTSSQEIFNNAGTLNWNMQYGPWGYSRIEGVEFNNSGTVNIASGANLQLYYSNGTDSGSYNIASGQWLNHNVGTRSLESGGKIQGNGSFGVAGGSFTALTGSMIAPTLDLEATGGTLTSEINLAPKSLRVSGGTLAGNGDLATNRLLLSTGVLTGSGTLTTPGTTTFSGNSYVTLQDKVWNNTGTVDINDGARLYLRNTTPSDSSPDVLPTFNNLAGGTVNMNSTAARPFDAYYYTSNQEIFNNAGTLNWNTQYTPWGYSRIEGVEFNNSGTVNIASGANLQLYYSNGTDSGTYNIASAQWLNHNVGTRTLESGGKLQGGGSFSVSNGSFTALTGSMIAPTLDLSVTGGTFTSEIDLAPSSLSVSGGTLVANGDLSTNSLALTRGTLTGSGTLTTPGTTTLSGNSYVTLRDKVWNNPGTLNIIDSAYLYLHNTTPSDSSPDILPTFNNLAAGVVNMNSTAPRAIDAHYYTSSQEIFNNAGTLNWNTQYNPWGHSRIEGVEFNNSGTVNIASGANLQLYYSNGTDSGTYNIASGQSLNHNVGTRSLESGGKIQGNGSFGVANGSFTAQTGSLIDPLLDLAVTGGTLASEIDLAPKSLSVSGGTLVANGDLSTNSLALTRGTLTGSGTLTTPGTTIFSGSSNVTLQDKVWNNSGTVNINDSARLYLRNTTPSDSSPDILPTFNNLAGGTVNVNSTAPRPLDGYYYTSNVEIFNNAGTLNWNGVYSPWGYSVIDGIDFNNSGIFNVASGSNLEFYYSNGTDNGTYNIAAGQYLRQYGGARTVQSGARLNGSGTILVRAGEFTAEAGSVIAPAFDFELNGGVFTSGADLAPNSLTVSGGTLVNNGKLTTANMAWSGGVVAGSGTLNTTGTTTLSGSSYVTLGDTVWNNSGTIDLNDSVYIYFRDTTPSDSSPDIQPTLNNLASGTLNVNSTAGNPLFGYSYSVNNNETLNNAGTINWNGLYGPWGYSRIHGVDLNNAGTVNVTTGGNLQLYYNSGLHSGTFNVADKQSLDFHYGTHSFDDGSRFSGLGTIEQTATSLELVGSSSGLILATGRSLDLNSFPLTGSGVLTNRGTVTGGQGISTGMLKNRGAANLGNITLAGLDNGGNLTLIEENSLPPKVNVLGTQAILTSGKLDLGTGGTFVKDGGTLQWAGGSVVSSGSGGAVQLKNADIQFTGTGNRVLDAPGVEFNFVDFEMPGGSLTLDAGKLTFDLNNNISSEIPAGSSLTINGGELVNNGPLDIYGNVLLNGGDYYAGGNLNIRGGSLAIANTFGAWNGPGVVSNYGQSSLAGSTDANNPSVINSAYDVNGGLTVTGFVEFANTFTNSGTVDLNGTTEFQGQVDNTGTLNVAGPTTFTAAVTNRGAINLDSGSATFSSGLNHVRGTTSVTGADLTGDVTVSGGTFNLANGQQVIGDMTLSGGTLKGDGGILTGKLTVTGGTLAPGASPGTLTLGSLDLKAGATTEIEIGGTAPGTDYDVIKVLGAASLGGTLEVLHYQGFLPTPITGFDGVIDAQSLTGTFATVNTPVGHRYDTRYGTVSTGRFDLGYGRLLTITADDKSRIYGDPNPTWTASFNGLYPADSAQSITGLALGTSASAGSSVGSYAITPSGASAPAYYAIQYAPGTLTVNQRPITVTASAQTKAEGSSLALPATGFTASNLALNDQIDSVTLSSATGKAADLNAAPGTYQSEIVPSAATGVAFDPANYAITYQSADLTITQALLRTLTITANDLTRPYGDANPPLTASFSGLLPGDTAQIVTGLTFTTVANPGSPVADYVITPGNASAPAGYRIQYQAGTLSVTPRQVTVTGVDQSKTEGTQLALPASAFTASNLAPGERIDSVTLTSVTGKAADRNVAPGTYAAEILPSGAAGATFNPANYAITYLPGDLTVVAVNTPAIPLPPVPQPSPTPAGGSQTSTPTTTTNPVSNPGGGTGPGPLYTVASNTASSPAALLASTPSNPNSTPSSRVATAAPVSSAPAGNAGGSSKLFTARDTLPPSKPVSSGLVLPQISDTALLPAIERVSTGNYTPEERSTFFTGLSEQTVISGFQAAGKDKLATFYASTANGEPTNAAQLVKVLRDSGITDEEAAPQLAVYTRMRQIAMTKLLSKALQKLEQNPDLADVFDDGVAGGDMQILLDGAVEVHAGIARIRGRIASESNKLYLGVNDQWVYVDPEGRFEASVPVPKGHSEMVLTAKDHGEGATRLTVPVFSDRDGRPPVAEGRRIALVIGVEAYDHAIPELDTPVNDARTFGKKLVTEQQFEVKTLLNPSKREILDSLTTLAEQLAEHDTLTVFYAGHGYQIEETGRGYWLPRDAETHDPRNWVSNRDIARIFHNTPARQILLVSDSCYSGAFTEGQNIGNLDPKDVRRLRAVMALSSGGDQPVWDGGAEGHSIFAAKLLETIRRETIIGMPFYHQIRDKVVAASPQVPRYGAMIVPGRDNGADFVLLEPQI